MPPLARRPATACLAAAREDASAIAMRPSAGNTGQAVLVPAMTANPTPSRTTSTAAAVAARASAILVRGYSIDPEQSMMMISALPSGYRAGRAGTASPAASAASHRDDGADVPAAFGQVLVLVDVHGEAGLGHGGILLG